MVSEADATRIVTALSLSSNRGPALRKEAMNLLDSLESYNWSGIYRLQGEQLILDEFVGAETDHKCILVGQGVCGTAIAENLNQVIGDVRQLENYLSCSVETRSEIVVLIRRGSEILGQIDIDGHQVAAFDESDERLLTQVAQVLADRWT